jgi:hypothetical protein
MIIKGNKQLLMIYVFALFVCASVFVFGPEHISVDTVFFDRAKDLLLKNGELDHFRTPLYPIFLIITYKWQIAVIVQYLIFLISIGFLYTTLKMLNIRSFLIYAGMLIYLLYPAFTFYHNQLISESLTLSLCTISIYFLLKYIKYGKTKDCWSLHAIILTLIFIKPALLLYIGISAGILIFIIVTKKTRTHSIRHHIISLILVLSVIGGYSAVMGKKYGVYGISSVGDLNLYWMLRQNDLIDIPAIQNEELKKTIMENSTIEIPSEDAWKQAVTEALHVLHNYGWKELHSIVNTSLKTNYKEFLFGKSISSMRQSALDFPLGYNMGWSNHYGFLHRHVYEFSFYHLFSLLGIHLLLLIFFSFKSRIFPILSITLSVYIFLNLFTLYLTAPNDYARLILPALPVSLIVLIQVFEWLFSLIHREKLVCA